MIQPGKTAEVPFTVTVPDNATPGDYVGGILTSLTQSDEAEGINVDRRLGIRVKLRVGGELKPNLAIEDLHVDYAGSANPFGKGDATVTYTIHNTGNADPVGAAGGVGLRPVRVAAGPRPGDIAAPPELLPGESWKVKVPVHGVAPAVQPDRDRDPHPAAHRRVGLHHPAQAGPGHRARLGRPVDAAAAGRRADRRASSGRSCSGAATAHGARRARTPAYGTPSSRRSADQ